NTPDRIPVKIKFLTPNGQEYKTIRKTLNGYGSFETEISLPASAMTGTYTAQLLTANDVYLAAKYIRIEEFVPDRIRVKVEPDKEELHPGEDMNLSINAMNLFGPPAAGRNYEVEQSVMRKSFYPKNNRGYNYYIEGASTYFRQDRRSGITDEQGNAVEIFNVPKHYEYMGVLSADYYVTVFDETGRPVNRRKGIDIYTQDVFYGISGSYNYFKAGQEASIGLIAVDKEGNALNNIDAQVVLIRHEYRTVLNKSGGYFRYRSEHEEVIMEDKVIRVSGTNTGFVFIPELSGQYELRVSAPGVNTFVRNRMYCYGWGRTSYSSFKVNNEGQIDIEFDKDEYTTGDKAKVIMKTPFAGKVLVTVENNKVIKHFYRETDKRAVSFELDVKEDYVPNVYITATLFKPNEKTDLPFTVAHGFAPMMVDNPANRLPLKLEAAEQSRSRTKQKITVKSKPNSAVTVAVVDEGILQVTGYQTPDPYSYFYGKRALEVNSYDIYPYLFPELSSSVTGGGGMDMEKRVNPMENKRIQPVAFWSGILETDNSGEAEFEIDIPQFSGELRIMGVNYLGKAFASDQRSMKVADPLVISTALPRFFSPRDTVEMPVMLANTTKDKARCNATIAVEGPVKVLGDGSRSLSIPGNAEGRVVFRVVADAQLGGAKITIKAEAMGETFLNETDITVRPASPLIKYNGAGVVKAGGNQAITMDAASFMPQSVDNKLIVSKSPLVQFADDLEYLVRYPYGCVEQTTSAAFPQLYYTDIVKDIFRSKRKDINPAHNVNEALKRLMLMQLYNGGLTYWPQSGSESWWGTVYAAHFALEAQKAGYQVDQSFIDKMLEYLIMRLKKKEIVTYYYNNTLKRDIAPHETAYSLYVLSLAGEPQRATLNYYKSNSDQLSLDSRYMLAAAFALAGDKKSFEEMLPGSFEGEVSVTSFGGSFYSHVRDEAIALNVLLEVDPDNPQTGLMAKHITDALKTRRYLNTQERAFSFLALGKIAKKAAESNVQATITKGGKTIASFDNKTVTLTTEDLKGTDFNISVTGDGQLYYLWEIEGISADGSYKEEDNYIRVRKAFFDRDGKEITNNTFRQNDLVVVRLSIESAFDTYIENVAISDILPAGFEIENPRLTETATVRFIYNDQYRCYPSYQDIRDDRLNLFVDVSRRICHYYYMVRAVSRGSFQMGPVGADAMYNGEYHSYNGAGVIRILEK
ncbi:MAG: alpha-2-macroglobulin family protein, partial [Bacteroidetes bacterium]|nr:alpha-2-macroglobulin family protein [Bacteroidota bacterium]